MVMMTEKRIALSTSTAPVRIQLSLSLSLGLRPGGIRGAWWAIWRKMFSTMITVPSTMMPRSMAPTDSRFADSPRITVIITASSSATGIVAATIRAQRRSPRNTHWMRKISAMPNTRLCRTVRTVIATRSPRS
jgi:hypothetical protein